MMNLEEQISEVKKQIDLILSSNDGWFSLEDYSLLSKSARRKDSRYGLITDILKYGEEGQRIIDHNSNKRTLNCLYDLCMDYIDRHPTRDFPGGFSNRQIGWKNL